MDHIVLSQEEIQAICKRLGAQISEDLKDEPIPPVFICIMKGAAPFYNDLVKNVSINIVCDYMRLSSYAGLSSTGNVKMAQSLHEDITDRTVVIVEDIVDTGLSMDFLLRYINEHYKPKKVLICALFDKVLARRNEVKVDYVGHVLDKNEFLVGYGLDYKELLRNVPYVYVPTKEEIAALDAIVD
ncbi:MAG: hypoxanthine phosphoribosyltransferase [Bacilli bacterium]|nr:hypoxanthine phosphoribosyltransferase [Bacilli bacterium]